MQALPDHRVARRSVAQSVAPQTKTIYDNQVALGWAFRSFAAETQSSTLASTWTNSLGAGINGSRAICTTLQAAVCCCCLTGRPSSVQEGCEITEMHDTHWLEKMMSFLAGRSVLHLPAMQCCQISAICSEQLIWHLLLGQSHQRLPGRCGTRAGLLPDMQGLAFVLLNHSLANHTLP